LLALSGWCVKSNIVKKKADARGIGLQAQQN